MKRPDMREFFRSRIEWHTRGMMAGHLARRPSEVKRIEGDVDSREIVVHMMDGTVWKWEGGKYSSRKVNGCYAPLMPKPKN